MPISKQVAINFLESQWSSINENKIKGIIAELRFEAFLNTAPIRNLYEYLIPAGWIMEPSRNNFINPPTKGRIAIIPIPTALSWSGNIIPIPLTAQIYAESYFRQVGISTYFMKCDTNGDPQIENGFVVPVRGNNRISYELEFLKVGADGLINVPLEIVTQNFTNRNDLRGFRTHALNRINQNIHPWNNNQLVTYLFWKEYSRYFLHRQFLASANDIDFFIVGNRGRAYPIEFKSKTVVQDQSLGDWFGLDIGPFTKLSFFVSLSNNMEALFFVEEVDNNGLTLDWWGVKFTELLKNCYWVSQGGGTGMGGGLATTVKIPKSIFTRLQDFLPSL